MARKFIQYEPGSAEAALQARIAERYGDNNEPFFRAVADRLGIRADSASGAFYRAMRREGSLPESHKAVYFDLLEITPSDLFEIGREAIVRAPADPLAGLREEVAALTAALEIARGEHRKLAQRVATLEKARRERRTPAESPQPGPSSRRARSAP